MSMYYSVGLTTKNRESVKQIADYAIELTKEWSLKELGYDLTEMSDDYIGFEAKSCSLYWHQLIGAWSSFKETIPVDIFTDKIAKRFPQMYLRKWETWEGPVCYEAVNINGEWEEVKNYSIGVYVEKSDDFNILKNMMKDKELLSKYHIKKIDFVNKENFVILTFDELFEKEKDMVFNGIIGSMNKLIPQSDIFCILIDDLDECHFYIKKCKVRNGVLSWNEINSDDFDILEHYSDFESNHYYESMKPKKEYVKLLFKEGEERDTLLANIPSNLSNKDVELPF